MEAGEHFSQNSDPFFYNNNVMKIYGCTSTLHFMAHAYEIYTCKPSQVF